MTIDPRDVARLRMMRPAVCYHGTAAPTGGQAIASGVTKLRPEGIGAAC